MSARRFGMLGVIVALSAATGLLAGVERRSGQLSGLEGLELWTLDLRQRSASTSHRADDGADAGEIVLVLFDSASVRDWPYLSPYPRPVLAELVDALAGAGARTIGIDVYLDRLFPVLNEREGGDDLLREAIARAGNVVLVASVESGPDGPALALPHEHFVAGAAGVGAAEIPTPFETVRDGVIAVRSGDGLAPGFALALWAHSRGIAVDSLLGEARLEGAVRLEGMPRGMGRIPRGWREAWEGEAGAADPATTISFPLRFIGPPSTPDREGGTFPTFSSSQVPVVAAFVPEFFRDRIVLVGTGFHDSDKFRTPFYSDRGSADGSIHGWTYGVEVHANILQNFLDGAYLRRPGLAGSLAILLTVAALSGGVVFTLGATWGAAAALLAALAVTVAAFWAYAGRIFLPGIDLPSPVAAYLWIPIVPSVFSALFAYLGSTAYVSVIEGREKRFIRSAFGKYVSPEVVSEIAATPGALRLGGQNRSLSILFSDLAGFTSMAEGMAPEELIALLNEYLTEMTAVVMEEEGTLDKYIGDAIMAFWNAPKAQPDHADRALRCAIRMQERMAELNERWTERKGDGRRLRVRIGVNTGMVVVGNVGGEDRFDYSAIGDAVNLAARLEPANDSYGTLVMTSAYTLDAADANRFRIRELDLIAVKGKLEPVRVYEVVGFAGAPLAERRSQALALYERGLEAYRDRRWTEAADAFFRALEADPDDAPSRIYLQRSKDNVAEPPPLEWDFVVRRTTK